MILKRFVYFLLLSLGCLTHGLSQQTYPIQVNAHLLPPYSLYLSDYYSGTREKLTVTLINRDQLKPTVSVKLRMIITAPGGIRIQTNDNAFFQPVSVESGMPVRLTQDDLTQYFQPDNLVTQGYLAAGKLPEGMVEFCFQAVEAYTGQILSASTCTRAWITSQKPPLLSLPRNNESVAFRDPLNVLFQWTPLHQGIGLVEYDFILKEIWDNGMTVQAAFPYSSEIYRETIRSTSIIYGALQPPLIAGKRYAWCVQAKAREGLDEVNLFQNNGYSEIRSFILQDNCAPPQYVEATAERKRINLSWNGLPENIGFTVSYRIKVASTETQNEWKELQSQESKAILYGLQSGATYEYRVASMCMAGQPVYTPVMQITVPAADSARLAQCGLLPAVNLANQEPAKELKTSEQFKAGDFPITIVSISGGNGTFSGQGWTIIPWLNDAKIAVEFTSITINTDHQMTNGFVEAKYDKNEGQIANIDDVFEGGFDVGKVKTGLTRTDTTFDFSIPGVDAFTLNNDGDLVITDTGGEPHTIAVEDKEGQGNEGNKALVFPMTVKDKDGNVYKVEKEAGTDANGKPTEVAKATFLGKVGQPLAAGSFDPTQLNSDKAVVRFDKGDGHYAFDTWEAYYDKISLIQDKYQKLDKDYYAPWKYLPAGQTDKVSATIEIKDPAIKPELVIFKTPTGTEYKPERNGNTYVLQLAAGPENDVQELYALYPIANGKYYTLGKLGIATYAPQNYNVVLVAVDNVAIDYQRIEQTLKNTYGVVGVNWTVTRDAFAYDATGLMTDATGLSTYNDAMKALNNAYKAARPQFDKNANYLFFLKATGNTNINNRDLTGFMPRGAQFGYIFTSETPDAVEAAVVAHELGHGRWKLYHPFDKHYGGFDEAKATDNLLSYGNGTHLAKWQWDQMNDPAMVVSVFEGDDRSEYSDKTYVQKVLQQFRCAFLAGNKQLGPLDKKGIYFGDIKSLGMIRLTTDDKNLVTLVRTTPVQEFAGGPQGKILQTMKFGLGLMVQYYGDKAGAEKLQDYLFPASSEAALADKERIRQILLKTNDGKLTSEELELVRSISNCGAQYFSVADKIVLIKLIANYEVILTEINEDLILDLISNYSGDFVKYAQELLDGLSKEHQLMGRLFYQMDNKTLAWGRENNADRFTQEIFALWNATTHSKPTSYTYVEDLISSTPVSYSPYVLAYSGKSIFPKFNFGSPNIYGGKVNVVLSFVGAQGETRNSKFAYDYFQPIALVKEYDNRVEYLSLDIPAIMFARMVEDDNFEIGIKRISLTADIALTLTGVGNLSKLRHLTKLQRAGRYILAGVEFGSSVLDLLLNYTNICTDENKEFCETLKTYNFYIQMTLLGGEAVGALYRKGMQAAKVSASAAYVKNRDALVRKYGSGSEKVKLMDEHFGFVNGVPKWFDDLPKGLKSDIGDFDSDLGRLFTDATDAKRAELLDVWDKFAEYPNVRKDSKFLQSYSKVLADADLIVPPLSIEARVKVWIETSHLKCRTCANGSEPFIDEVLDNLYYFKSFLSQPGAIDVIDDISKSTKAAEGANWLMKLTKNKGLNPSAFEEVVTDGLNFTADIVEGSGSTRKYFECKSWESSMKGLFTTGKTNFTSQLTNYLHNTNVTSVNQFGFHFNPNRWTPNASDLNSALKASSGLFKTDATSWRKYQTLFQFGNAQVAPGNVDALIDFITGNYFNRIINPI